jgi:uncharacterized protein (DUF1697 family)
VTRYVALLKGVNVGGHKRVKMADLRDLMAGLGHSGVRTFQAAGNVLFTTADRPAAALAGEVEGAISATLGLAVRVMVRRGEDVGAAVARSPLASAPADPARYFVGFLSERPGPAAAVEVQRDLEQAIAAGTGASDRVWLLGEEAYFWCPASLSWHDHAAVIERRLGVAVTTRNWNTVTKLAEMTAG